MPKITVGLAESAVADLEQLKRWYSERGVPDVGDRLVAEILERIEALCDHPDMGQVVPEFSQPFLRELIYSPFRIVYRREPKKVRVIRIWRSERLLHLPAGADDRD